MKKTTSTDSLYATPRSRIIDFEFDDKVADVFDDMIERSVPGYRTVIAFTGLVAERYAQPNSQYYDLGCSLGGATLSMRQRIRQDNCRIIAVDNSKAMIMRCRENLQETPSDLPVHLICADVRDVKIQQASVVILNFTLQFIATEDRFRLVREIYEGLLPGGALILSEKTLFEQPQEQQLQTDLHDAFKKANGYSGLEISQKRTALENVLIPDSIPQHYERLRSAGFRQTNVWFQCFNFVSFLAVK